MDTSSYESSSRTPRRFFFIVFITLEYYYLRIIKHFVRNFTFLRYACVIDRSCVCIYQPTIFNPTSLRQSPSLTVRTIINYHHGTMVSFYSADPLSKAA